VRDRVDASGADRPTGAGEIAEVDAGRARVRASTDRPANAGDAADIEFSGSVLKPLNESDADALPNDARSLASLRHIMLPAADHARDHRSEYGRKPEQPELRDIGSAGEQRGAGASGGIDRGVGDRIRKR
jgi:hypothetical protein